MEQNAEEKLNSKKSFNLNSNFWFFTLFVGVFFWIGYSITKNIYLSKFHSKTRVNKLNTNKEFPEVKNLFAQGNHKKQHERQTTDSEKDTRIMKKIISLPSDKDANIRLEINYSQVENQKNQAIFKKNRNFFTKQTVESLMKLLNNTKKTKSSKVEAD